MLTVKIADKNNTMYDLLYFYYQFRRPTFSSIELYIWLYLVPSYATRKSRREKIVSRIDPVSGKKKTNGKTVLFAKGKKSRTEGGARENDDSKTQLYSYRISVPPPVAKRKTAPNREEGKPASAPPSSSTRPTVVVPRRPSRQMRRR